MIEYRVGDVFDRLAEIGDGSIDLIVTSPPFLALRSYLPADHPDKHKEIGSEPTPAAFIDTLLALTAEFGRVLAPHGSLCVELGDTFSGSGGAGGDYNADGLREGQGKFDGSASRSRTGWHRAGNEAPERYRQDGGAVDSGTPNGGPGWPLAKSLTGIPTLYPWSLAYGRNLLTGVESPAGRWRIRNIIVWARPNPPVGALGDKFRPATSYITIACRSARRFFDLDAVRLPFAMDHDRSAVEAGTDGPVWNGNANRSEAAGNNKHQGLQQRRMTHAGAPPLDWHTDLEDGDWLWKLPTQPYKGSHYATFPLELPTRLIMAMCPLRVCTECGKPSERIVGDTEYVNDDGTVRDELDETWRHGRVGLLGDHLGKAGHLTRNAPTLGWSDCGHNTWRTGVVLDPFAGSGTTLEAAQNVGRHAIGIDLDPRNADLARSRVGMYLEVDA